MSEIIDKFEKSNASNESLEAMSNSLKELNEAINKSIGIKGEKSMEALEKSKSSIKNLRDAVKLNNDAKVIAESFGISDKNINSLTTKQKIILLQSYLKKCCEVVLSKGRSFYKNHNIKAVDGDFGINTALAVRGVLLEKGRDFTKNKFDGKITDQIISKLLEKDKADVVAPKADVVAPKADVVAPKADVVAPKADVFKEQSEQEKIDSQLHDLGLTSGGGKFDAGRYEGLDIKRENNGKISIPGALTYDGKHYPLSEITKEGRKHLRLEKNGIIIEKDKTLVGKILNIGKNVVKKTAEAVSKETVKAGNKLGNAINTQNAKIETKEEKAFNEELQKFGLNIDIYNKIQNNEINTGNIKAQKIIYKNQIVTGITEDLIATTLRKEGDNIIIGVSNGKTTGFITIDSDKKIKFEKKSI